VIGKLRDDSIDWPMFAATVLLIVLVCVPILAFRDVAAGFITDAYDFITTRMGVAYIAYGVATLGFLVWLAFSRFGAIRLGAENERPDFSTYSWVGMLFCAGVGAGLLYWAVIEWGYYIDSPPLNAAPRSDRAIELAASYGIFHWGITGWAFFCLPTIAIAYAYYVRRVPQLRLSTGVLPFLPGGVNSKRARFIDYLFMINLIGGTGTSLGLATPMIAASVSELIGVEVSYTMEVMIVVLCIAIFGTSAWLGLDKGIKRLTDFNMIMAKALLLFILIAGPTLFILKMGVNSIGLVLQEFIRMNTWTDPVNNGGFIEAWTVFYWAWWVAYGPFVGIFVTRISRGRTIREVIVGMLTLGSIGAAMFFIVIGNYSMSLELNGIMQVTQMMKDIGEPQTIAKVFTTLPMGEIALAVFAMVAVIFVATTYDSASYCLASVSTKALKPGEHPARWHRLFWALAIGILPVVLMLIDGDIKIVLSTTIVVSLPLLVVGVMLIMSIMKMLREDEGVRYHLK